MEKNSTKDRKRIKPLKLLWNVIRRCQFEKILAGFACVFLLTAAVVTVAEPSVANFRDGLWYTFVACTTIGFGDIAATTFIGRLMTIIVTVYEIVVVALLSGVVVSYYLELVHRRENETLVVYLDKLEHLSEMDRDELKELEDQIRSYRDKIR